MRESRFFADYFSPSATVTQTLSHREGIYIVECAKGGFIVCGSMTAAMCGKVSFFLLVSW